MEIFFVRKRLFLLLCAFCYCIVGNVLAMKIAFVGDTGMENGEENGFGRATMNMIENEGVDLVVDVGDFDYWGRCVEEYEVTDDFNVVATNGYNLPVLRNSTFKRFTWLDGRHGSLRGWEIGIINNGDTREERMVISHGTWASIVSLYLNFIPGERDCEGEPWDGPWYWRQFLRGYEFDFLGASGNSEVTEAPLYGSPEIWAAHQRHMWELYKERIFDRKRGVCRGFYNQTDSVQEYGERYSCFYGDHHIIFLGWWQGSNERSNGAKERSDSVAFIEREFSSSESRVQNSRWRYCVHHMTSAKLSAGGASRDRMVQSGITDACRKHGALIISGHHHLYSRTKMLKSVGGPLGDEPVLVADEEDDVLENTIMEGRTMSITVGMGGFDGACNGKYANATWMERCVASRKDHRGAVIANFDEEEPWKATFRYLNSVANASVVDEFALISRLRGWNHSGNTRAPTIAPSNVPSSFPSDMPTVSPSDVPTFTPYDMPTSTPSDMPSTYWNSSALVEAGVSEQPPSDGPSTHWPSSTPLEAGVSEQPGEPKTPEPSSRASRSITAPCRCIIVIMTTVLSFTA